MEEHRIDTDSIKKDSDEIIEKINSGSVFNEINFFFVKNESETFEMNVRRLKEIYEQEIKELENKMNFFKTYIENYFRKKIQQAKNNHLNSLQIYDHFPIMNFTSEHSNSLKGLRELYEKKSKQLEQVIIF